MDHPNSFTSTTCLGRRFRLDVLTSEEALEQAKAFARAERDKGNAALRNDPI